LRVDFVDILLFSLRRVVWLLFKHCYSVLITVLLCSVENSSRYYVKRRPLTVAFFGMTTFG